MKNVILSIVISFVFIQGYSNEEAYFKIMSTSVDDLNYCKTVEAYLECANKFERIANKEKSKWLPYYYASFAYVNVTFLEQDASKKDPILDKAQELLDIAFQLAPDESELYVLQAFLYPSRIMVDPMGRGMLYLDKIYSSLDKAEEMNPDNPRIYFLKAINKLNMPESMGGGSEISKPIFEIAREKFNSFVPATEISPDWGKDANDLELQKLN